MSKVGDRIAKKVNAGDRLAEKVARWCDEHEDIDDMLFVSVEDLRRYLDEYEEDKVCQQK